MRVLRLAAVLAALGAVLGGASSARADVKVPKALAGVELHEGATKVEIDRSVKRLGGREVIVFRTRYRAERIVDEATVTETVTELAVVDADSDEYLFREPIKASYEIERHGYQNVEGAFEYRVTWDGGADLLLTLTLAKSSGAGPPVPDARRVWQVRYGALSEVGPVIAECPRGHGDDGMLGTDTPEMREAAVQRFVQAIDLGKARTAVRCAYGDALVASGVAVTDAMLPATGHEWSAAPVASDCPGAEWAERHGLERDPRRAFVFTTIGGLAIVTVRDDTIETARVETFADHLGLDLFVPAARAIWSEVWVIDERLWFFAELELEDLHGAHGRYVVAYDPLGDWVAAKHRLDDMQTARFEHRTGEHGVFEVIVSGKRGKTMWSHEAASWRQ